MTGAELALGWFGALLLAFCGLALFSRAPRSEKLFLWLWFAGEFCMLAHVARAGTWALRCNYGWGVLLVGVLLWRRRVRPS